MATTTAGYQDRGRSAERPTQIPKAGWRDIVLRLNHEMSRDYLGLVAAGVAFYFILAIVPTITAVISIYGLVADPNQVTEQVQALEGTIPPEAASILEEQMTAVAGASSAGLGLGLAVSILFALWSASTGANALIKGLNIAYDEEEKRGFVRLTLVGFALTLGIVLFLILTVLVLAMVPVIVGMLPMPSGWETFVSAIRWPIMLLVMMGALALLYRYAPSRSQPQWSWVSIGAVLATIAWLVGSAGFSLYAQNFADYNETYGSMGAIVILMLWFWITAFVIILGGALNAEMEAQTRTDTTAHKPRPRGQREAVKADELGRQP